LIEKHLRTNQGLVVSAPQLHKYRKDDEEFAQGSFTSNGNLKQLEQEKSTVEKLKDAGLERPILKKGNEENCIFVDYFLK
jgi:hypothetical protein